MTRKTKYISPEEFEEEDEDADWEDEYGPNYEDGPYFTAEWEMFWFDPDDERVRQFLWNPHSSATVGDYLDCWGKL